jgi:hypothetical protein
MADDRHELQSLGRDVTRGGVLPQKSDRAQSLGEQDTGADGIGGSTASDLRDLADDPTSNRWNRATRSANRWAAAAWGTCGGRSTGG